ncbi:MAG: VWA domain-containing protein [Vicinamibacterales bacterium]
MNHRRSRRLCAAVAAGLALTLTAGAAQQQPPAQRAAGTLREGVTAVLVDVVVRDKRGQPVHDLAQADFEVLEDGVPQTIGAFTPVFEGAGLRQATTALVPAAAGSAAAASGSGGGAAPAAGGPVVTALVFDRLGPEARQLAVKAAMGYIGAQTETPSYIGIFGVDLSLSSYAPFTRNGGVLRQALERIGGRATSSLNGADQQRARALADQRATAAAAAAEAGVASAGQGSGGGTGKGDAMLAQMEARALQEYEVMERDQSGYSTTNGLFAIISTLRTLPGRKSMVLFSEGISIPPAVQRLFAGVIDAANRANVSIYTMDAAGLRAESELASIRDQVNGAAGRGGGILGGSSGNGNAPLSKALEKNEDVLRQDPHFGLGTLAQSTGGMLFDSTNNLRQAFDRVETDLRNYYLLGYTPNNDAYDGRFRTIDIKVKRPGVTVAARKGYYAVRSAGVAVNPWEAPALGELERKPVPNAFPVRAGFFLFPERDRPGLVPIVVDFKTAGLSFQPAADGKTYSSDFAVLVRMLDATSQVARKVSQHYEITGPVAEVERARQGDVLFYREIELPAGVYTMETVVYDAPSGKSSVRLSTVEVPGPDATALRLSSLVVVKRGEKVPEKDRRADNPLLLNDVVLYPNLGDAVSKSAKELGFYFTAYPAPGGPAVEATLQLLRNDVVVAQVPMPLAAVDASGRIQQAGRLPLEQVPPGTYDLRVIVKQGNAQAVRSTLVRITN